MRQAYVDANVILRYLTNSPPKLAERAAKLFAQVEGEKVALLVPDLIIGEVVWTLESFYGFPKPQIAQTLRAFFARDGIVVRDTDLVMDALTLYEEKNINFADALLGAFALREGPQVAYSFDRHLDRIPGLTRLEPGSR